MPDEFDADPLDDDGDVSVQWSRFEDSDAAAELISRGWSIREKPATVLPARRTARNRDEPNPTESRPRGYAIARTIDGREQYAGTTLSWSLWIASVPGFATHGDAERGAIELARMEDQREATASNAAAQAVAAPVVDTLMISVPCVQIEPARRSHTVTLDLRNSAVLDAVRKGLVARHVELDSAPIRTLDDTLRWILSQVEHAATHRC
jgi:hypothetical protein